jgi:hypothetical protein
MRRVGIVLVLALGLLAAPAASIAKSPNAAVVVKNGACSLLDATGASVPGDRSHVVVNKKGTHFVCRAKGLANDTGKAIRYNFANTGLTCQTSLGPTERWQEVISAGGRARLVCHLKVA